MILTNDAKAVVALTTRLGQRSRPSLTARMWHQLGNAPTDSGRSPENLFDESSNHDRNQWINWDYVPNQL